MAVQKSPSAPADSKPAPGTEPTPAQLAKAALRRLAEQRLEPTPDNYRKAYDAEAGVSGGPGKPAPEAAPAPVHAEDGERWATLIGRILRGAERGGRQWTAARKKDSLQRVLEGSRSSADRLHQRLNQLVGSWDSDTLDNAPLESAEDAPSATAEGASASSHAGHPHRHASGIGPGR